MLPNWELFLASSSEPTPSFAPHLCEKVRGYGRVVVIYFLVYENKKPHFRSTRLCGVAEGFSLPEIQGTNKRSRLETVDKLDEIAVRGEASL